MDQPQLWIRESDDALVIGPFTNSQVRQLARAGLIRGESSIRQGEAGRWHRATEVKGLLPEQPVLRRSTPALPASRAAPEPVAVPSAAARESAAAAAQPASKAEPVVVGSKRGGAFKLLLVALVGVVVVGGLGVGGYFVVRGGGVSIPFLSPSPASDCESAAAAMKDYVTAMQARNTDAAGDAMRAFLVQADRIMAPDFEARIKKLSVSDQAAVRPDVEEIKLFVLALGARSSAIAQMDTRLGAAIAKTRSMLNCANMDGASAEERSLVKQTGMWQLPDDIATHARKLADAVIAQASGGR